MNENMVTIQTVDGIRMVSIREFIQDKLYGVLDLLVKDERYVYFAFEIIATGIEFLGACMDDDEIDCDKEGCGGRRFRKAINTFQSLQKYKKLRLYKQLRCGMCHVLLPKFGLKLTMGPKSSLSDNNTLYIDTFYDDFRAACEELLTPGSTLWGNGKGPNQPCWEISTDDYNLTPVTAVTKHNESK